MLSSLGSLVHGQAGAPEAESFEDAIPNAIGTGGDGDTIAAIAGSVARTRGVYGVHPGRDDESPG